MMQITLICLHFPHLYRTATHPFEYKQVTPETIKGTLARFETSNYTDSVELALAEESENDQFLVVSNAKQDAP
jgi:hypothetical protein